MPDTAVGRANGMSMRASIGFPAREFVAHQRPGDDEPEHQVDGSGEKGGAKGQLVGPQRAGAEHDFHEVMPSHGGRHQHQRRQRNQHDGGEEKRGEPEGQTETRQHARLFK